MGFERHRQELQLRRERLRMRSAELRLTIADRSQAFAPPLALADQAQAGVRWLRAHPEWPLGTLALLLVMRPRRVLRWGGRLWMGWRLWRRGQRALQALQVMVAQRR
jgi:YqjK-like protein